MRLRLKEQVHGNSLMCCGIEFQTVGAANWKALRLMALAVKVTCRRLSEEERRCLGGLLKSTRQQMHRRESLKGNAIPAENSPEPQCICHPETVYFLQSLLQGAPKLLKIAQKLPKNTQFLQVFWTGIPQMTPKIFNFGSE